MGNVMPHELILYISAASDLLAERDLINRAIAEIPADMRWNIVQSPLQAGEVDALAIQNAFTHLLILGGDIRAPIGHEYQIAKQVGRPPLCLLKRGVNRTAAAVDFQRFVALDTQWQPISDPANLRRFVLEKIGAKLLKQTAHIGLTATEYDQVSAWLDEMGKEDEDLQVVDRHPKLGENSIILSESRLEPEGAQLLTDVEFKPNNLNP